MAVCALTSSLFRGPMNVYSPAEDRPILRPAETNLVMAPGCCAAKKWSCHVRSYSAADVLVGRLAVCIQIIINLFSEVTFPPCMP